MSYTKRYIFLSPHLDDAIFSCGDYISKLISCDKEVTILTIFAGYPQKQKLQFSALQFHKQCNLGEYPIKGRIKEDILACKRLHCSFKHLPYFECLYRQDREGNFLYPTIYSSIQTEEILKKDILEEILLLVDANSVVFCPLSIGNHVDHILVNEIGKQLELMNYTVIYYEDFPYISEVSLEQYHQKTKNLKIHQERLQELNYIDRISAILCYKSQISIIWKSIDNLLMDIKKLYLRDASGYSIRFWVNKEIRL
ncbi:PIG-L family deacetylase [Streptococcus mitis]|uniref:PIG-L family deacetylase n=1 Tax=Streptococcus mitis TaxID=28037 RepID=UPI001931769A|nr:PIG-L family deacetylase [Streptococcus mitis]